MEYEDSYKSLKEALLHGAPGAQAESRISTGSSPRTWMAGLRAAAGRVRRHSGARRIRQARRGGHDQRDSLCARKQSAVLRHLPRDADHGDRVRAQRLRPGARQLDRVRSGDAGSRDLQAARVEGRRRAGRNDASGRVSLPAHGRQLRASRPTARRRSASGIGIATNSIASTKRF